jgi:hypothetical protein
MHELQLVASQIQPKNELPLEERLKDALNQAKDGVMADFVYSTSADFYGQAALAAVYGRATPEEKARLDVDLKVLKALQAAASGVPVDWENALPGEDGPEPVGLSGIVRDWAEERGIK